MNTNIPPETLNPLPPPRDSETDEMVAAAALLMLAYGGSSPLLYPSPPSFIPITITAAASSLANGGATTNDKHSTIPTNTAGDDVKKHQEHSYPNTPWPPSVQKGSHKCDICGKVFRSHQALGGHKTTHRAAKSSPHTAVGPCKAAAAIGGLHECSICQKVFPTGQALGGHKRKHYDGMMISGRAVRRIYPAFSDCSGGANGRVISGSDGVRAPVVVNIDLNLPPTPEFY